MVRHHLDKNNSNQLIMHTINNFVPKKINQATPRSIFFIFTLDVFRFLLLFVLSSHLWHFQIRPEVITKWRISSSTKVYQKIKANTNHQLTLHPYHQPFILQTDQYLNWKLLSHSLDSRPKYCSETDCFYTFMPILCLKNLNNLCVKICVISLHFRN